MQQCGRRQVWAEDPCCHQESSTGLSMSQLSHDRLPFGQKSAFSSSHYTSGSHTRFALSVHILPVCHFAVRKLPNPHCESSWNICSWGVKVPRMQKFQGAKVLGLFAPRERIFHGMKVPQEQKFSLWTYRSQERKYHFYASRPTRTGPVFMLDPDNQGPLSLPIN